MEGLLCFRGIQLEIRRTDKTYYSTEDRNVQRSAGEFDCRGERREKKCRLLEKGVGSKESPKCQPGGSRCIRDSIIRRRTALKRKLPIRCVRTYKDYPKDGTLGGTLWDGTSRDRKSAATGDLPQGVRLKERGNRHSSVY